jgi:3-oxoacid CoA-transferase B subunit
MMRGGHLTHAVLGAIEVAANGDFANWRVPSQAVPGVGGAMDLAVGVPNTFVAMNHVTNKGQPKIVNRCTAPLTARQCVKRIFTDMAVIDVARDGLVLREVLPGLSPDEIQKNTEAPLKVAADCREIDVPMTFKGIQLRQ